MKLSGTVKLEVEVSGPQKEECGSDNYYCQFEANESKNWCYLFQRYLKNHKRCTECREAFK